MNRTERLVNGSLTSDSFAPLKAENRFIKANVFHFIICVKLCTTSSILRRFRPNNNPPPYPDPRARAVVSERLNHPRRSAQTSLKESRPANRSLEPRPEIPARGGRGGGALPPLAEGCQEPV